MNKLENQNKIEHEEQFLYTLQQKQAPAGFKASLRKDILEMAEDASQNAPIINRLRIPLSGFIGMVALLTILGVGYVSNQSSDLPNKTDTNQEIISIYSFSFDIVDIDDKEIAFSERSYSRQASPLVPLPYGLFIQSNQTRIPSADLPNITDDFFLNVLNIDDKTVAFSEQASSRQVPYLFQLQFRMSDLINHTDTNQAIIQSADLPTITDEFFLNVLDIDDKTVASYEQALSYTDTPLQLNRHEPVLNLTLINMRYHGEENHIAEKHYIGFTEGFHSIYYTFRNKEFSSDELEIHNDLQENNLSTDTFVVDGYQFTTIENGMINLYGTPSFYNIIQYHPINQPMPLVEIVADNVFAATCLQNLLQMAFNEANIEANAANYIDECTMRITHPDGTSDPFINEPIKQSYNFTDPLASFDSIQESIDAGEHNEIRLESLTDITKHQPDWPLITLKEYNFVPGIGDLSWSNWKWKSMYTENVLTESDSNTDDMTHYDLGAYIEIEGGAPPDKLYEHIDGMNQYHLGEYIDGMTQYNLGAYIFGNEYMTPHIRIDVAEYLFDSPISIEQQDQIKSVFQLQKSPEGIKENQRMILGRLATTNFIADRQGNLIGARQTISWLEGSQTVYHISPISSVNPLTTSELFDLAEEVIAQIDAQK